MATSQPIRWPLAPLIVPPISHLHKSTFIVLHGRGSTADKFASPLLIHLVSSGEHEEEQRTFQEYYPNSKFVFPTAQLLRARAHNRSLVHQWFDTYPLESYPLDYKSHVQIPGLRDSVGYVHELLRDAILEVGAKNVVLMGLSQGCTTALASALLWEGERIGAVMGMCGCLPFLKPVGEAIAAHERSSTDIDDVFERTSEDGSNSQTPLDVATEYLQEELDLASEASEYDVGNGIQHRLSIGIPVFLGHGVEDEKVPFKYGKDSATLLDKMGTSLTWRAYENLGHWYSADMLRDFVVFLKDNQFDF